MKPGSAVARVARGRGVHDKLLVAGAVEVRQRKPGTKLDKRKSGRYAGRVRLAVAPDRSAESLCGFIQGAVAVGAPIITDDWSGYASLAKRGYKHLAVAERGDPQVVEEYLPIIHLVFSNLKTWLSGIHHGVSDQHLQAYLNEFTFRFNSDSTRSTLSGPCSESLVMSKLHLRGALLRQLGAPNVVAVVKTG